jgi:hypothetical protein
MGISSNKAYLPVAANSRSVVDLGIANYYVEARFATLGASSSYMIFRYVDASNYWRIGQSGASMVFEKIVSGSRTTLSSSLGLSVAAGDRIGVECNGNTIKIYVNGKLSRTISDAANATGTSVGLNIDNTAARFDHIIARSIV